MAEVEAGFLNTYQARWQLAADSAGFGFAQGKSMLWRRDLLDAQAASKRSAASLPKTPPPPRSFATPACASASPQHRSPSLSVRAPHARSGTASSAGPACAA